jgi:hypothetical protein
MCCFAPRPEATYRALLLCFVIIFQPDIFFCDSCHHSGAVREEASQSRIIFVAPRFGAPSHTIETVCYIFLSR